jgi:hypothetical protein
LQINNGEVTDWRFAIVIFEYVREAIDLKTNCSKCKIEAITLFPPQAKRGSTSEA